MKHARISALFIAAVVIIISSAFHNNDSTKNNDSTDKTNRVKENGFAVIELFTSEGCSSCPPADALISKIQSAAGDKPIYVLAYHVDYWNRLGWKDIFSDHSYTQRQYEYSQQLGSEVYTPQVVVNGQSECVGSDEGAVNHKIQAALSKEADQSLSIQGKLQPGKTMLHCQTSGNTGKSQLLIALLQKHAVSNVKKGENEGRTLSHVQIVRKLFTLPLQSTAAIELPSDFNTHDYELIGMLQNPNTGAIGAAAHVQP